MREPTVMLTHSLRPWARRFHFFLADHGGATVRGYASTPEEALTDRYDVLLIDDVCSFLSARLVDQVTGRGALIIGVHDDGSESAVAAIRRLRDMGVERVIGAGVDPEALLETVVAAVGPFVVDQGEASRGSVREPASPPQWEKGSLLVVAGAGGGTGATEIALALAGVLRDRDRSVVLLDADDQAPAVAQRLGLRLHPNIRTAIDSVQHKIGSVERAMQVVPELGIEIVAGLPSPSDWSQLRPYEMTACLDELLASRSYVVANIGPVIEDLPELNGPARFGVGRAVLSRADVIVAVAASTPTSIGRALAWMADASDLNREAARHVAINRHPGGTYAAGEILEELVPASRADSVTMIPFDARVVRAAWDGVPVGTGRFTRAVNRLAARSVMR